MGPGYNLNTYTWFIEFMKKTRKTSDELIIQEAGRQCGMDDSTINKSQKAWLQAKRSVDKRFKPFTVRPGSEFLEIRVKLLKEFTSHACSGLASRQNKAKKLWPKLEPYLRHSEMVALNIAWAHVGIEGPGELFLLCKIACEVV